VTRPEARPTPTRLDPMRIWSRVPLVAVLSLASLGMGDCGGGGGGSADADALTRRQRDSLVSELPVPGAGGVGKAMDAADAIDARNAQLDSIR
jgi:hypothetical protein